MNTLEAPAPNAITRSLVSDWVGDPIDTIPSASEAMPNNDRVVMDHHQITERMIDMLGDVYSSPDGLALPMNATVRVFRPLRCLLSRLIIPLLRTYATFTYDSIDVTLSITDPKAIAGGVHVGWYPYRDQRATNWAPPGSAENNISAYHATSFMMTQHLLMTPTCEAMYYGFSKDVKFNIPWQFNTPSLFRNSFYWPDTNHTRAITGEPILFTATMTSSYVSDVHYPPNLKVFVKFNNLRFGCPNYQDGFVSQMEAVAPALLEGAAVAGAEILSNFVSSYEPDMATESDYGSFEQPSAVQLSYAGDTTVVGPPAVSPTFCPIFAGNSSHRINDFLSRPQLVGTIPSGSSPSVVYANPFNPLHIPANATPCTTWFNFFGMHSAYWRGTIYFDLVIMGHALVETAYKVSLLYPAAKYALTSSSTFSETGTLEGIAKGVVRIRIPIPWGYLADLAPNYVKSDTSISWEQLVSPAAFTFTNVVRSAALQSAPMIPTAVYISAGPDFMFYWPKPPGLYHALPDPPARSSTKPSFSEMSMVSQIGLPVEPILFESRAQPQEPMNEYQHPLRDVEDFFRYWCRCLPYDTISSNDEPVPDARYACFPGFGYHDSAAWTPNVNNSWYICQDYLGLFSQTFLWYRGSIGLKAICVPTTEVTQPYKYMALDHYGPLNYVAHNPFTSNPSISPQEANFGVGAMITPSDKQPVLEFTMPFISRYSWAPVWPTVDDYRIDHEHAFDVHPTLSTNLTLIQGGDLKDALFRKAGADFQLAVETLPPSPYLWRVRGGDWS